MSPDAPPIALPPLRGELVSRVSVTLDAPLEWTPGPGGQRRVVPITGGRAAGARLSGEIVPGGADWQLLAPDGTALVEARYTLRTDDGELILVDSRGTRAGPTEVLGALKRGEAVDPSEYVFRTAVRLEAGPGAWDWVNRSVFVAVAARAAASVVYDLYELV